LIGGVHINADGSRFYSRNGREASFSNSGISIDTTGSYATYLDGGVIAIGGDECTASGALSTAIGIGTKALGDYSLAIGYENDASG
jgi:hypothetical protein